MLNLHKVIYFYHLFNNKFINNIFYINDDIYSYICYNSNTLILKGDWIGNINL